MMSNPFDTKGMILMYHRIADLKIDPWGLCVSPAHFEEHLKILRRMGCPLSFRQVAKGAKRIFGKRVNFGVSFDDGYADNFQVARAILIKYRVPATFFIVSGMVGKREEFWWDELEKIVLASERLHEEFNVNLAGKGYCWTIKGDKRSEANSYEKVTGVVPENGAELSPLDLYYALWHVVSDLPTADKKAALKRIGEWGGQPLMPRTSFLAMTEAELKSLSSHPFFEIGAHTVNHPMLANKPVEEQRREIIGSKVALESIVRKRVDIFSCPHGSYTDETATILKEAGFRYIGTSRNRNVGWDNQNFLLPRRFIPNWDGEEFERRITGWLEN